MISLTTCAGRELGRALAQVVVVDDLAQPAGRKLSACRGKRAGHFAREAVSTSLSNRSRTPGKAISRADLRRDREIVPPQPQLPQQPRERARLACPWA